MEESEIAARLELLATRVDHVDESSLALTWGLVLAAPAMFASGFTLAWTIARAVAGDALATWPAVASLFVSLAFVPLAALRLRPQLWRRNVAVMRDNLLVLVVTTAIGVGLFLLGLTVG